jgi:predicted  nucleic acid-binding Zn-ribbon protein
MSEHIKAGYLGSVTPLAPESEIWQEWREAQARIAELESQLRDANARAEIWEKNYTNCDSDVLNEYRKRAEKAETRNAYLEELVTACDGYECGLHDAIVRAAITCQKTAEAERDRLSTALDAALTAKTKEYFDVKAERDALKAQAKELQIDLAAKQATIADLRDFAYNRAPKIAAEELQKQREGFEEQLAEANKKAEGWVNRCQEVMAQLDGQSYLFMKLDLEKAEAQAESAERRLGTFQEQAINRCEELQQRAIAAETQAAGANTRYESAVNGRRAFRQAYRDQRELRQKAEAKAATLRAAVAPILEEATMNIGPRSLARHFQVFGTVAVQLSREQVEALQAALAPKENK